MNLRELCEPLFLYVCLLNRAGRKGGSIDYRRARGEIESIFADMRAKAQATPGLSGQFEKVELALIFFVDSMIAESRWPAAREWHENRLAFERNELAGDEKFFDILEATLGERGEAADERLAVLYHCLGLGFTGWYAGQPEYLRSKTMECAARLRKQMDASESARLCPEAYEHVDQRNLIEPPGAKLLGITVAAVVLVLVVFAAVIVAYTSARSELKDDLQRIHEALPQAESAS
jgi:type IV/VI secretion system ImpK/VasF family protein